MYFLPAAILMFPVWRRSIASSCTVNRWLGMGRAPTSTHCMVWENCRRDLPGKFVVFEYLKEFDFTVIVNSELGNSRQFNRSYSLVTLGWAQSMEEPTCWTNLSTRSWWKTATWSEWSLKARYADLHFCKSNIGIDTYRYNLRAWSSYFFIPAAGCSL